MLAAILPFAIIGLIIFGLPALAFAIVVIGVWAVVVRRLPDALVGDRRVTRRWATGLVVGAVAGAGTLVAGPMAGRSGSSPSSWPPRRRREPRPSVACSSAWAGRGSSSSGGSR